MMKERSKKEEGGKCVCCFGGDTLLRTSEGNKTVKRITPKTLVTFLFIYIYSRFPFFPI